jgi:hypothetical protein
MILYVTNNCNELGSPQWYFDREEFAEGIMVGLDEKFAFSLLAKALFSSMP